MSRGQWDGAWGWARAPHLQQPAWREVLQRRHVDLHHLRRQWRLVPGAGAAQWQRAERDADDADVPCGADAVQALLQGQWSALDDYFTVSAEGKADRWKIVLVPRPQTAAFIKGVQVTGARFIERIHVEEASGDAMNLVFERPNVDEPLSETELRLFKFE